MGPHEITVDHRARASSSSADLQDIVAAFSPRGQLSLHQPDPLDAIGLEGGELSLVVLRGRLHSRVRFQSPRALEPDELNMVRDHVSAQLLDGIGEGGLDVDGIDVEVGLVGGPRGRARQKRLKTKRARRGDLVRAIEAGDITRVAAALDGGEPPDARSKWKHTALSIAARDGHLDICRLLLERGADADGLPARSPSTPLQMAAMGGHREVLRLLLDAGADPDTDAGERDEHIPDYSPLGWACSRGHTGAAEQLIERGADVNHRGRSGATPLHATRPENLDIVELLLRSGADPSLKNRAGRDALAEAELQAESFESPDFNDAELAAAHRSKAALLRDRGSDPPQPDRC